MTYSPDVTVGGPATHRATHSADITKIAVGPLSNNVYFLTCRATGKVLLIDAADEADVLLAQVDPASIDAIITTHRHGDHWQALERVANASSARLYAGRLDANELPIAVESLDDGDTVTFGEEHVTVISVPGHTPGSIVVEYREPGGITHLFTGDSLFPGGVGKTWSEEDFDTLINNVEQRLFDAYDDDSWVYPGHGTDTTLGVERPHLADWRERRW